jgi:hypothetical protein
MKHYPALRHPALIAGLTHTAAPARGWMLRCLLCLGIGFGAGLLAAALFVLRCCQ